MTKLLAQLFDGMALQPQERLQEQLDGDGRRFHTLRTAMAALDVPEQFHRDVVARWKRAGGPKLVDFAPFSRYVLLVNLFKTLSMASGLMNPDKTSNFADVAYLYYLPFCQVFISSDKLHRSCVPLFRGAQQQFVWGHDLRPHLRELAKEYLNHPDLDEVGLIGVSGLSTPVGFQARGAE